MKQFTIHVANADPAELTEAHHDPGRIVTYECCGSVVQPVPACPGAFRIGLLKGKLGIGPDFFEPMRESDLDPWEGGR